MNSSDKTEKSKKFVWTGRLAVAGLIITIAGFACAPLGISAFTAMAVLGLGSLLLIVAFIVGAIGLVRGGIGNATPMAWVAIVAGAAAIANFGSRMGSGGAPIHDISTDTADPPAFVAVAELRGPNDNPAEYTGGDTPEIQKSAYPDIETIVLLDPRSFVFQTALEVATDMGWEIVTSDAEAGRIEATASTPFVGFKDDVVIRVRSEGAETLVDVRSKSRLGRGDMGVNANRIRAFRDKLIAAASPE